MPNSYFKISYFLNIILIAFFVLGVNMVFAQSLDDAVVSDDISVEKKEEIKDGAEEDAKINEETQKDEKPEEVKVNGAPDVVVSPVVVDDKAKARDILKKIISIKNNSSRKVQLYPSVNNVDSNTGEKAFDTARNSEDLSDSLANWIEMSRGVIELDPGEEKDISFIVRVNLNAIPGNYHAQLSFYEGTTRKEAEEKEKKAAVMVNMEVLEDIKEDMQLGRFITDRIFFSGDDVLFTYDLENIGNKDLLPEGEIRIYNRKGEEVASIDANKDQKKFAENKMGQLASVWNAGDGFGRYKAFLNLNYGDNQKGSIQDTVFFWVVPWKMIAGVFGGSLFLVILFASLFHKWLERRRMRLASELNSGPIGLATAPVQDQVSVSMEDENNRKIERLRKLEKKNKRRRFFFFKRKRKDVSENIHQDDAFVIQDDNRSRDVRFEMASDKVSLSENRVFTQAVSGASERAGLKGSVSTNGAVVNLRDLQKNNSKKASGGGHVVDLRKK